MTIINYKMVIKRLVLKKRSYCFFNNSVLLKDFDKTKLKIVKHDCVGRYFIILIMSKILIMLILCT